MGINDVAQANVALQYDPQQDAIARRLAALKATTDANAQGLNQWGNTGQAAINNTYDTLDSYLQGNRTQTNQQLQNNANLVGQGWNQAAQVNDARVQDTRNYMNDLATRLGQTQALPETQGNTENLLNKFSNINSNMAAAQQGNAQNWAGMMDSILGQGQNIAKQTRSSKVADFRTQVMKALAENQLTGLQGENDLNGRLADILGQRGNALTSEIDRLAQQQWQQQMEQAKLDQSAAIARTQAASEQARLNMAARQADQSNVMDLLKLDAARRQDSQAQSNWEKEFGLKQNSDKEGVVDTLFKSALDQSNSTTNPWTPDQVIKNYNDLRTLMGLSPLYDQAALAAATQAAQTGQQSSAPPANKLKKRGGIEMGSLPGDYTAAPLGVL